MASYLETEPTAVGCTQTCGGARKSPHEHGLRRLGPARDALLKRISLWADKYMSFPRMPRKRVKESAVGLPEGFLAWVIR